MNEKRGAELFELKEPLSRTFDTLDRVRKEHRAVLAAQAVGTVTYMGAGVARVAGLSGVKSEELLRFPDNRRGLAFNLDQTETGVVMLDENEGLAAGDDVLRTGTVLDVPVGEELLGRVVDPLGRPLDNGAPLSGEGSEGGGAPLRPIHVHAPSVAEQRTDYEVFATGTKVIDLLAPLAKGAVGKLR